MTPFAIRPATIQDADPIARVRVDTWRDAYAGLMPADFLAALDPVPRAALLRERLAEPGPFANVVAVRDGEVVGFVTLGPYRDDEGMDATVGEVLAIYVHPRHQGLGAGRALMDAAVAELAAREAGEVRLWVLESNAASRRFYERYGLVPDGVRQMFRIERPGGSPVDLPEVRYAMPLPR